MEILLATLQVLFFAPVLVRLARRGLGGAGVHPSFVAEITAGARKPALIMHGGSVLVLWAGVVFALRDGRVTGAVTVGGALGAGMLVGATLLMAWSLATLRTWRLVPGVGPGHKLTTTGPYRFVRHPVYLALDLLGVGSAVWVPTATVVAAAALLVVGGDLRARLEERFLIDAFGDRYCQYMRRVRRTIPFLY